MESFYGGKKGNSFALVKTYDSISDMYNDFISPDCEVSYGEYVLISSPYNKLTNENGRLYKRGYDKDLTETVRADNTDINGDYVYYDVPTGGGIYIGTIAGPAGQPSRLSVAGYDEITDLINQYSDSQQYVSGTGEFTYKNNSLIDKGDVIKYAFINILNPDDNTDCVTKVGFQFPVPRFSINYVTTLDPQRDATVSMSSSGFQNNISFSLPRGVPGDRFKSLIITDDGLFKYTTDSYNRDTGAWVTNPEVTISNAHYTSIDGIKYDESTGNLIVQTSGYGGTGSAGKTVGNIKMINNISLSSDGQLMANYNTSKTPESIGTVKYVNNAKLSNGVISIQYNTSSDWTTLGYLTDYSVINVAYMFNSTDTTASISSSTATKTVDFSTQQSTLSSLQNLFSGDVPASLAANGKLVLITNEKEDALYVYGYSKDLDGWKYVGNLKNGTKTKDWIFSSTTLSPEYTNGTVWFVEKEM